MDLGTGQALENIPVSAHHREVQETNTQMVSGELAVELGCQCPDTAHLHWCVLLPPFPVVQSRSDIYLSASEVTYKNSNL